ncbi:Omp85 family outer membrane protein [Williamwhitmania taraxaci]|uniref:Surface antigen n=1 Tax=Williamwhitmania taraxaci TaxID=1640674 RepID=A0A1G6HG55_9BACT|nr:BamA/TamA family outer membrane protein [Williamwhitmania taraxaci]SDB93222.1 Surface antigen [Williamwhitmania taraxaci]
MRKYFVFLFLIATTSAQAKQYKPTTDSLPPTIKTGWTFGALPAITFDSDLGFQYGGIVNLYYYGDGSTYPTYQHSIYAEVSRFTKGSGINRLFYDSKYLIPGIRVTSDASYLTDQASDFYGWNGQETKYKPNWVDDGDPQYVSRVFYKYDRKLARFSTDLQGKLYGDKLYWAVGIALYNFEIGSVDLSKLNRGKSGSDKLPDVPELYDKYVSWGLINSTEKSGGFHTYIKAGVVFDTRDFEANPSTGIWAEAIMNVTPPLLGEKNYDHANLSLVYRQYLPVVKSKITFAYRLATQLNVAGKIPFYLRPNLTTLYLRRATSEGLGGSQTLRGIMRSRVVGNGIAYGNFELRWKFLQTVVRHQNLYLSLNLFSDIGQVIQPVRVNQNEVTSLAAALNPTFKASDYFTSSDEKLHTTYGAGLRIAINENFIIAADYGRATSRNDGTSGLYIALNFLF